MKTIIEPQDFTPRAPDDFIGGANTVARVLTLKAKQAKDRGGKFRALLYGVPGVGKTRLAEIIAAILATNRVQIESVNGRNVTLELVRKWQDETRYVQMFSGWNVKIVNELDTCPLAAQDLLLTYLDEMQDKSAFIGTSNISLASLSERFSSRLQQFKVEAPDTEELSTFIAKRWRVKRDTANRVAVGSGGNVRAALLDIQSILDTERMMAA